MRKYLALMICAAIAIPAPALAVPHFKPIKPIFKPHKPHFPKPPKPPVKPPVASPKKPEPIQYSKSSTPKIVGAYVGAATFCSAGMLWITAYQKTRAGGGELSPTEAHSTVADCFLPFIGGHMIRSWYAQHPEWWVNKPPYR